jgi:KaiC/GvpD/RAD55 family RecA-like ATPase
VSKQIWLPDGRVYLETNQSAAPINGHDVETVVNRPIKLVSLTDFLTPPKTRAYIRGVVPEDSLVVVFGAPKCGKTFAVTDMTMHAAHGLDWHGCRIPRPLRVAFLAGEGHNGLKVRLHAWLRQHESPEMTGAFEVLPASLSLPDRLEEVITALRSFKPDVVVTDTLNAFFGAGDENSTQDMTRFVDACRRVRQALRCSVLLVHHTPTGDIARERGSGALRGAADVLVQVGKDESGSGCVGFQVLLGRDIEPMEAPIPLRLRRVETDWTDEDGQPLTTCVVEAAAHQPVTLAGRGARPLGEAQAKVLAITRELAANLTPDADGYVLITRTDVAAKAKGSGLSRQSISSAWEPLQTRGYLKLIEPGTLKLRVQQP